MWTFTHKPKTTQLNTSAKSTIPGRAHFGQSRDLNSILHLQRPIENQKMRGILQTQTEELNTGLTDPVPSRFRHNFSQIPIYPLAAKAVQRKIAINEPGDVYEREADYVAAQVMRMPEPHIQRVCECGGKCPKCQTKQLDPNHERMQAKHVASSDIGHTASPLIVNEVLSSPGQPLDSDTREFMEPRFETDFSHVRIRNDTHAERAAQAINAQAFTFGHNIVFGKSAYAPTRESGRQLLAHELTHVVQQRATVSNVQRMPFDPTNPEQRYRGTTLPHREATELAQCIRIMGDENRDYCRQEVLGEAPPQPIHANMPGVSTPQPTHVNIPGISTPQPFGTQANANGSTNFNVGSVNVVFLPDVISQDQAMTNRAETASSISAFNINYQSSGGVVKSFTGPGAVTITIVTTYGPGVTAASTSGYGRGTTASDVQAGNTSLGFHEGQHGLDFVQFLTTHSFPQFTGTTGMTVVAFEQAMQAYSTARQQFNSDMESFSKSNTDCVGTTIDQHNASNGIHTIICQQVP